MTQLQSDIFVNQTIYQSHEGKLQHLLRLTTVDVSIYWQLSIQKRKGKQKLM